MLKCFTAYRRHTLMGACILSVSMSGIAEASPQYQILEMGLTGGSYQYDSDGGIYQESEVTQFNNAGQVLGVSSRYDPSGNNLGQDAWIFDGSAVQQVGLTGSAYQEIYSGAINGVYQFTMPVELNNNGEAIGDTGRFSQVGSLGGDAWIFNGSTSQSIGLTGTNYSYQTGLHRSSVYQSSAAQEINDAGDVIGYSARYNSFGAALGQDTWYFNGSTTQAIGLTGGNYAYTSTNGINQTSEAVQLNSAGDAIGDSSRYGSGGTNLGQDAWFFNGNSTQEIGLTGGVYTYSYAPGVNLQFSAPAAMNNNGEVVGYSYRYNSVGTQIGQDTWFFNGSTSIQIGLTGGQYSYVYSGAGGGTVQYSGASIITDGGTVLGGSTIYGGSSLGDLWLYNGTTTQTFGYSPSTSALVSSGGASLTASGKIFGATNFSDTMGHILGSVPWYFNGTTTQTIGLTGSDYNDNSYSTGFDNYHNNAGQAIGTTYRYNSAGTNLGQDTWFFNGTTTQQIGLTGPGYEYSYAGTGGGIYRDGGPTGINASGEAIGIAYKFDSSGNSLGYSGWFFDPTTGVTTPLDFSFDPSDNASETGPDILTDSGVVLGSYILYEDGADEGERAFYWSESLGFHDLGSLVAGGLTAAGWQNLADEYSNDQLPGVAGATADGSPAYILGDGTIIDQTGGNSVYLLAAVPEPTSAVLTCFSCCVLLFIRPRYARAVK